MIIRASEEYDIKYIAGLERENFSDPWSEESLRTAYGMKMLVCDFGDNKISGYIIIRTVAGEAELLRICVAGDVRRGGIGRKLLEEGLRLAKEDGAEQMFLEVRSKNDPARGLYKKAGFEETGLRKNYYSDPQDDAVIMVLGMTGAKM